MMAHLLFHRMVTRQGVDLTAGWRRAGEDALFHRMYPYVAVQWDRLKKLPASRRWQ